MARPMPTREAIAIVKFLGFTPRIKTDGDTAPVIFKCVNTEASSVYYASKKK